jgi:hypothetical protein
MISHFAEIYEKKFNFILYLHNNRRELSNLEIARYYCNELTSKLDFIINDLMSDTTNKKFYYLNNDTKLKKIHELKAHILILNLLKFIHINGGRLTHMDELRQYIYYYGLNIDLKTCDAFNAPLENNAPFNINTEKILKFVRLCDFESLSKIFENLYANLMRADNLEYDYMNEHVELGQIAIMLRDFFEMYRKMMEDKVTRPENHLNLIRSTIKESK